MSVERVVREGKGRQPGRVPYLGRLRSRPWHQFDLSALLDLNLSQILLLTLAVVLPFRFAAAEVTDALGQVADQPGGHFAPVVPDRPLIFPRDTGVHPDFRIEWWYITGWLGDAEGVERGFQITFFRVGTGIGADNPSRFAPRHLILAHAAIADPASGRLRHAEMAERALEPLAGAATGRTHVLLRDWELRLVDAGKDAGRDAGYQARVATPDFTLDLRLIPSGPPVLNGRGGFSQKTPDPTAASYYYSRPQLAVTGQLRLDGVDREVSGQAWLDHEWSSELLSPEAAGWDWIGINLHDGGSLMAFQMRHRDGGALWTAGTLVAPNALPESPTPQTVEPQILPSRALQPHAQESYTQEPYALVPESLEHGAQESGAPMPRALALEEVRFRPGRTWQSPRTGKTYPVTWELDIAGQSWRLQPLMDDQELDGRRSTGVVYWEGVVQLLEGEREIGRGYLEMTGY